MKRIQMASIGFAVLFATTVVVGGVVGGAAASPAPDAPASSTQVASSGTNAHVAVGTAVGYADEGNLEGAAASGFISAVTTAPVSAAACGAGPGGCAFGAGYLA